MKIARQFVAVAVVFATAVGVAAESYRLYNIVPMYVGHEREQAAKSVEMYARTGEDLALYSLTLHPEGRPARAKVDRYVASYRAFAKALEGTKVRPAVLTGVSAELKPLLFTGERDNVRGVTLGYSPSLSGSVAFTAEKGTERLADFIYKPYAGAPDVEVVAPSTVFFRNGLGGQVVTAAYHPSMFCLQLHSEGRKRWFVDLVDRLCGGETLTVCEEDQDVLVAERVRPNGDRIVLAVNLGTDPIDDLRLRMPKGCACERLMPNGSWQAQPAKIPVGFYEAVVIRLMNR